MNHRPPGPEKCNQKIQVLHLVSLRIGKPILSLHQLSRSCTETPGGRTHCVPSGRISSQPPLGGSHLHADPLIHKFPRAAGPKRQVTGTTNRALRRNDVLRCDSYVAPHRGAPENHRTRVRCGRYGTKNPWPKTILGRARACPGWRVARVSPHVRARSGTGR